MLVSIMEEKPDISRRITTNSADIEPNEEKEFWQRITDELNKVGDARAIKAWIKVYKLLFLCNFFNFKDIDKRLVKNACQNIFI